MSEMIQNENTTVLEPGDIVTISGTRYRVLEMESQHSTLIEIDTSKTNIGSFKTDLLMMAAAKGEYPVEKYQDLGILIDENNEKYRQRLALIMDIQEKYAGDIIQFLSFHPQSLVNSLMEKHGIKSLTTFLYIIRRYVQSGCDNRSLMPEKHKYPKGCDVKIQNPKKDNNGRFAYIIQPSDIPKMDDAIAEYRKQSTGVTTLQLAYKYMLAKYYVEFVEDPNTGKTVPRYRKYGKRPSLDQFKHYYYKVIPVLERKRIKKRVEKIRNDNRLLPGGKDEEATHPGAVLELDACEVRVDLIGTFRPEYNVGKPILYVMKDVYSKLILAMSVGYGNNKTEALCKLFANMAADKTAFCERYGIYGLKPEMWPSGILPQSVHCDRGSDFKSKEFRRICENLKIIHDLVPGASGSMKGDVEQFFHQIQSEMDHFLKGYGLIEKDYGSKHKTEAVLNMLDITKICILYVIYYNNRIMNSFVPSIEMEEAKIRLSPVGVWNFGVENNGSPRLITNKKLYLDTLLIQDKASICRNGIQYKELIFFADDNQEFAEKAFKAQNKKVPVRILYDPNTIEYIKYVSDTGEIIQVPLNKRYRKYNDLEGYTFSMWNAYRKQRNARKRLIQEDDDTMEIGFIETMGNIVSDSVVASPIRPSDKNMKGNRAFEEQMDAQRESISFLLAEEEKKNTGEQPALSQPENAEKEELPKEEKPKKVAMEHKEYDPKDQYDPEAHFRDLLRLM